MKVPGVLQRRIRALLCITALFTMLAPAATWSQPARAAHAGINLSTQPKPLKPNTDARKFVPNELLVETTHPLDATSRAGRVFSDNVALNDALQCSGLTAIRRVAPDTYLLTGSDVDVEAAGEALRATGAVKYAGPNHLYHAMLSPNDEQYVGGQQWGVTQVHAEQAWDITTGSDSIVIAVLDTGTAADHPDLANKVIGGHDFANNDENAADDNGHGTYTAGIAAAASNNGRGVVGMSWGAKIMPVKVLSARGSGAEEDIALGIRWAVDNGARIISASLGGDIDSPVMRDAVKYAADHNVLMVAASGNTPDGNPNYPAAYDSVLAVGATGRSDTYTGFSSYGRYVDVTAPGVGILSTGWDNGSLTYEYGNGTSASCPFVSGVAALVLSVNPSLTAVQVKQIIEDSSDDLGAPGWDEHYGYGRLNAYKAVQMAQAGPPPPHTATPAAQPSNTPLATPTKSTASAPLITLNDLKFAPGALISILANGFGPNEIIDLTLTTANGTPTGIGNAQTNGQGSFRAEVALPRDTPPGSVTLIATGSKSGLRATAALTVTGGSGGQSRLQGTIRGGAPVVSLTLKSTGSNNGRFLTTQTDSTGTYSFSGLSADLYALSASAPGYLPAGPYMVQLDGTAADTKTVDFTLNTTRPAAFERVPPVANTANLLYFAPVGHTLKGAFLRFWQGHGGLAIFGYPLTEEFSEVSPTDGKTYTVQYFERNRFEYHPEFANTPNEVLMGLLGVESVRGRTFLPGAAFNGDNIHTYFRETQHSLSGPFLKYWQGHGGLAVFGYPISEEIVEGGYRVQYFERNRFEYHPEFANTPNEVLLGLLGVESAKRNGWIAP